MFHTELGITNEVFSSDVKNSIQLWSEIGIKSNTLIYLKGGAIRDSIINLHYQKDINISDLDMVVSDNLFRVVHAINSIGGKIEERGKRKKLPRYTISLPNVKHKADLSLLQSQTDLYNSARSETEIVFNDAQRSNYDVNTLYLCLNSGKFYDPLNAITSINSRVMNLVSVKSLYSDPATILDGPRIASKIKFNLSLKTRNIIRQHSGLILKLQPSFLVKKLGEMLKHLSQDELLTELEDLNVLNARPDIIQIIGKFKYTYE